MRRPVAWVGRMGVTIGRMSVTGVWRQTGRMGVTNGRMGVTLVWRQTGRTVTMVWRRLCRTILALRASRLESKGQSCPPL